MAKLLDQMPAVGRPQAWVVITAILHKLQVFTVGNQPVGKAPGIQQYAVMWCFIVEMETFGCSTDLPDSVLVLDPADRSAFPKVSAKLRSLQRKLHPDTKGWTMKQTSLRGIANKAASDKAHRFRNLFGMLTVGYLLWCWQFVNKRAASGVDRQDARSYQENLQENIEALVAAVKGGRYRAKLVLRRYIPKLNGKMRPLGIPAIADKLLQVGVSKLLEAIYEQDFLGCSYGYRPGVGALDAVRDLSAALRSGRYHYRVEADIRGFFDN